MLPPGTASAWAAGVSINRALKEQITRQSIQKDKDLPCFAREGEDVPACVCILSSWFLRFVHGKYTGVQRRKIKHIAL
jgi:hypothetical protein